MIYCGQLLYGVLVIMGARNTCNITETDRNRYTPLFSKKVHMSKDTIKSTFAVDQRVKITSGDYSGKEGIVQRLGAAASVIYVHVLVDNHLTVITFVEHQLESI